MTRVEDREFTEHVRWAHHGQQILAAVRGVTRQLHLAGGDDVQGVALLALPEDRGSAGKSTVSSCSTRACTAWATP